MIATGIPGHVGTNTALHCDLKSNLPNILKDSLLEKFGGTKQDLNEIIVMEIDCRFKAIDFRYVSFKSNNNGVVASSSSSPGGDD